MTLVCLGRSSVPSEIVQLGQFVLDISRYELTRGGKPVRMERIPMDLLILLVREGGRLVGREEIIERLWGKDVHFDTDNSINTAIRKIRRTLGEDPEKPQYIETVLGKGYRFKMPIESATANSDKSSPPYADVSCTPRRIGDTAPARPVLGQRVSTTRNVVLGGLVVCALVWSFVYYSHSLRSKAGQLAVTPAVTNVGEKYTPALSPDGQHLAFVWNGGTGSHFNLYVKVVGTEESLQLTKQPSLDFNPVWSPDGRYIAFCRILKDATGIYIIPALGGAERRVRNTLWNDREFDEVFRFGRLSWSPDGKLLAYSDRASPSEAASIFLLSLDSREVRRLTSAPGSRGDFSPEFSPDGQTLALSRDSQGVQSIYAIPVSGGEEQRLTSDTAQKWGFAWTPDGREIVFANVGWLWRVSRRGGEPEKLQFGEDGFQPSIRGNRLVYVRLKFNNNIWRRDLSSSGPASPPHKFITSTRMESGPQFSPDGSKVAFESTRSGAYEVWMCQSDGSSLMQLTHFNPSVTGTPRWSPDGQRIVFDSRPAGNSDIFVIDVQGGPPRKLTSEPSNEVVPSWSRDGRWIYFASDRTGGWEVWKMPSTGGPAVQVTRQGGFAGFESPDGKFLYYAKGLTVPGLWRIPTNGGEEVELISPLEAGYWGYWAVVENGIYYLDTTTKPGIAFFDITTHRITRLFDLENRPARQAPGLAVSPDKRTILYTQWDASDSEIILVQNFR
jgi:Tol biopolymer transport system component/DNA-binding winged helix-turn-helix (wHTH) protein